MSRRPATVTQADVRRVIEAEKKAGAREVEVKLAASSVVVRLSTTADNRLEQLDEIEL